MKAGLCFVAGAGVGIYVVIRGRRAAEILTVDGMTDRLKGAQVGLQMFREEVATGKVEKETELRERFALQPHGRRELPPGAQAAEVISTGSKHRSTSSTDGGD